MQPICLHNKSLIETYLLREPYLNLYAIGDLDDFFWPYTTWYASIDGEQVSQCCLVYSGTSLPTLLSLSAGRLEPMRDLLQSMLPFLPRRFYAHLSGDLEKAFAGEYQVKSFGNHYKMALLHPDQLDSIDCSKVIPLSSANLDELQAFYHESYPENWFDPRMLETGFYYGIRLEGRIASVAGIHVYSPHYRVAALGNITTLPEFRGRGFCTATTTRLCKELLQQVDHIGLNVKANNLSAIHCYQNLGFEWVADYEEYMIGISDQ